MLWEGELPKRVLKSRKNSNRNEIMKQLLGDEQMITDLTSEKSHRPTEQLFVEPNHEEKEGF